MPQHEVSLERRQRDYAEAEAYVLKLAEQWVEARTIGNGMDYWDEMFDGAMQELRGAKRRLETTERRLAKRAANTAKGERG